MPITYPRHCSYCSYVSNNPTMHHYHKQTHEPIPPGTLCDHGCGQLAQYKGTGGKYTCKKIAHQCTAYLLRHSASVTKQWEGNDTRKKKTKERFLECCAGNKTAIDKMSMTKRAKFGTLDPDKAKEYRHYARFIRQRAQKWAKAQGYKIGPQTYHVDHKLSIMDAWKAGLAENVVNHPANLQILDAKQNTSKGANSIITAEELLKLIE